MNELKNILISHTELDFVEKLKWLREKISKKATFNPASKEGQLVAEIIDDVRVNLDGAVIRYTEEFDNIELTPDQFRISADELKKAHAKIDRNLLASIKKSIENVRKYQQEIFTGKSKTCSDGTGVKYTPLRRVGVCVPGASAPLPSTVIMTAVPAQAAGVKEIAVVSPPRYNGTIHPTILAVCHELGITEVYCIGGVQAVAALAYGTPTIPQVDKIVGPGNQWVQTAKRIINGDVGIDSIAGPSEVLIIADNSANPAYVAADMLSQAEHAPGSAVLFTTSEKLAQEVLTQLTAQLEKLGRSSDALDCLKNFGAIIIFDSIEDCITWADEFATEHLQIQCGDSSAAIAPKIRNAGAIFIGPYTPVATGDYFAGPSHTLPTGGSARFTSPLSSNDFVKSTSIIEYTKDMLEKNAEDIMRIAEAEGLDAHAGSVKIRTKK